MAPASPSSAVAICCHGLRTSSSRQLRSRQSSASACMHYANKRSRTSDMKAFVLTRHWERATPIMLSSLQRNWSRRQQTKNTLKQREPPILLRRSNSGAQKERGKTSGRTHRHSAKPTAKPPENLAGETARRTKIASVSLTQSVSVHYSMRTSKPPFHLKKVAELRLSSSESSS